MFCIGNVSPEHKKLVDVAKECVELGLCDEILWLHDGEIKMYGNTKEVLEKYEEFMS